MEWLIFGLIVCIGVGLWFYVRSLLPKGPGDDERGDGTRHGGGTR